MSVFVNTSALVAILDAERRLGIREVFAFDRHFADQGFALMPSNQ